MTIRNSQLIHGALAIFVTATLMVQAAPAGEKRVTVVLRGANTAADTAVLLETLKKVKGIRIVSDDVKEGFRRFNNRFTSPIIVTIPTVPGEDDVNIGQLAKEVAEAKTGSRSKFQPGVNLLLFTDDRLQESSISSLRSSLASVNGVEVNQPGGLGGNLSEGWCWIRLENAGGAMLNDIEQKAAASGITLRRLKESRRDIAP